MKKTISLLIITTFLLHTISSTVTAADESLWTYNISNGNVTITGYTGSDTVLVIPDSFEGAPVTAIGMMAFWNSRYSEITSVTIPDSVVQIGTMAFQGRSNLSEVIIGDNIEFVGSNAFHGTPWLDNQPDGLFYIGKVAYSFRGVMPENTSIEIAHGTISISDVAFSGQSNLIEIEIPDGVTNIGNSAFRNCNGLTRVTLPDSVTRIGFESFRNCTSLTELRLSAGLSSIDSSAFRDCTELYNVTIPNGVTLIGNAAFRDCTSLVDVTLPDSIISIGESAFRDCISLESITIPPKVTIIELSTFRGCISLTDVVIPDSVTVIDDSAFRDCVLLENLTIGRGVVTVGSNSFRECMSLSEITLPEGATRIGNNAFWGCSVLNFIAIPDSMTSIGEWAFYGTEWLGKQSRGVIYAGRVAYTYQGALPTNLNIRLRSNTVGIADAAFASQINLISITVPESVVNIGARAFERCGEMLFIKFEGHQPPELGSNALRFSDKIEAVYIPIDSGEAYAEVVGLANRNVIETEDFKHGHIRGNDQPIGISDALQLLMCVAGMRNSIILKEGEGSRAWNAGLIVNLGADKHSIADALHLLMHVAGMRTSRMYKLAN